MSRTGDEYAGLFVSGVINPDGWHAMVARNAAADAVRSGKPRAVADTFSSQTAAQQTFDWADESDPSDKQSVTYVTGGW